MVKSSQSDPLQHTSRQPEDRRKAIVSPHWPKALVQARDIDNKPVNTARPGRNLNAETTIQFELLMFTSSGSALTPEK